MGTQSRTCLSCKQKSMFAVSSWNQTVFALMSRPVSHWFTLWWHTFRQAVLVWYPSVTPQLSPACRGQSTWPAAECLFTGEAGQSVHHVEESEPVPSTAPAWPPTQSVIFLFSLPKGQINKSLLHEHVRIHTHTHWARRQPSQIHQMGKIAGVLKKRLQSECMSSWKMEHCLPFSLHSTFLGCRSIFIFHS